MKSYTFTNASQYNETNLSFCVTENDCLCNGERIIQITESVELPLLTFNSHKELFNALQSQFITKENKREKAVTHSIVAHAFNSLEKQH